MRFVINVSLLYLFFAARLQEVIDCMLRTCKACQQTWKNHHFFLTSYTYPLQHAYLHNSYSLAPKNKYSKLILTLSFIACAWTKIFLFFFLFSFCYICVGSWIWTWESYVLELYLRLFSCAVERHIELMDWVGSLLFWTLPILPVLLLSTFLLQGYLLLYSTVFSAIQHRTMHSVWWDKH
jgi:hypothetical protein